MSLSLKVFRAAVIGAVLVAGIAVAPVTVKTAP
jgi:hypothetical protein